MFKKVKGMRDFYPEEFGQRSMLFDSIRSVVDRYGFCEVESPAIESFELLSAKQGDDIKNQIFTLEKQGKESLGLRFDLTVPITRMFSNVQISSKKPVKWYSLSRMWRYEQPQKGRLREFYQLSVELFGSDTCESDLEVVALSIDVLRNLGLTHNEFVIKINNRKFLQGFLESINVSDIEQVFRIIDNYTKIELKEFKSQLKEINLDNNQISLIVEFLNKKLSDFLDIEMDSLMHEGYKELIELFDKLKLIGLSEFIEFSPFIARGLSYYTGLVFECFDRKQKFRAILGGGRYNHLVSQFGGQETPSVGFAIGDVTLELLLKEFNLWPKSDIAPHFFVAYVNENVKDEAIKLAYKLRENYIVDLDLLNRKLGKQLYFANSIGCKYAIIVGEDEIKKGLVVVRDMNTGYEETKSIESLLEGI